MKEQQQQIFLFILDYFRYEEEFSQRLKLQDQILQLKHQLEHQKENCLQVRLITLLLNGAFEAYSASPNQTAKVPAELSFLQQWINMGCSLLEHAWEAGVCECL